MIQIPVSFRRLRKFEAVLRGKLELFSVQAALQKNVDPESGMTLNLVQVDRLILQTTGSLNSQNYESEQVLLLDLQAILAQVAEGAGAQLTELQIAIQPAGPSWVWRGTPQADPISLWQHSPARIESGNQMRVGHAQFRLPPDQADDFPQHIAISVSQDSEILQQLCQLCPAALEILFQDLKSGQTWRKGNLR